MGFFNVYLFSRSVGKIFVGLVREIYLIDTFCNGITFGGRFMDEGRKEGYRRLLTVRLTSLAFIKSVREHKRFHEHMPQHRYKALHISTLKVSLGCLGGRKAAL